MTIIDFRNLHRETEFSILRTATTCIHFPVPLRPMSPELRRESITIMFADVVEFVRLIDGDELNMVQRARALFKLVAEQMVPPSVGTVLETRGDGLLIRFANAQAAARCAFKIHEAAAQESAGHPDQCEIQLRIGIHSAEVFTDEQGIYGSGVNLAARIASLAAPGETMASGDTRDAIVAGLDAEIEDMGDCFLKHVAHPVRAFRMRPIGSIRIIASEDATAETRTHTRPCLAVVPFQCSGNTPESGALGDLIAQSVIHAASRSSNFNVIAWLSSKVFANRNLSASEIGKALDADWILTGSCFLSGKKLLVQAELIRVSTNLTELSERIVDDVDDLLQAESAIAGRLASVTGLHLANVEAARVARHALPNLESHSLLVGAVGLMHRNGPAEFIRSKEALEHLMERHPRMHGLRPWLAKWYVMRTTRGLSNDPKESAQRALEQTARALDARPDDTFALAVQGFVHFHLMRDIDAAARDLESAVSIDPNDALASIFSSAVMSAKGQKDQAWARAEHAMQLSPFDPLRAYMRMIAASCALTSEKYQQAALLARDSVRESASHAASWRTLIIALVGNDEIEAARDACKNLMLLEPSLTISAYQARLSLPAEQARKAVDALRRAGVPLQ